MKILCVLLPHFPINCEKLKHHDLAGRPVIITAAVGSQKLVMDYTPELKGLQREMPLQQALSLHGNAELIHADIPHYASVSSGILDALDERSPLVEGADLGDIYIGLDGLQMIYETDDILVNAVYAAIPDIFEAHVGIGENKFMSYLAASYSAHGSYQKLTGDCASFLKDLNCDLLPVSLRSKEKLHSFGLHKLGQVAALAPGPLQAQFGPEGLRIWELANGRDDTPLYPRLIEETIEENTTLPSVTALLEVMMVAIEGMLTHAFTKFEPKGMGIRSVNLWTRSWMGEHWEKTIQFKEPAMHTRTALSRIKLIMENSPQLGLIEQVGMKITGLGRPNGRQKSLFTSVRAKEHLMDDVKQLEFRLGGPQLYRIKEVEPWSRIPERRYALIPLSQ
jgi:DNA polymerase-4/protein ImuB